MRRARAILGPNGQPIERASVPDLSPLRARYDAAQTTDENRRHWANADGLSARTANSPAVREKLRQRSRYEMANNCYAWGLVDTLANDAIGPGPRLQMLTDDEENNSAIEKAFAGWCEEVGLSEKLRVMRQSKAVDGEAFAVLKTNLSLRGPVKLDLDLIEADRVAHPTLGLYDPLQPDGLRLDRLGRIIEYTVLRYHPGDDFHNGDLGSDTIPADLMIHWFKRQRPGQVRGVPEITPALPLFAQLRRYTLAVLAAAETAADFAALLESDLPPDTEGVEGEPFEELEISRRLMMTLPAGYHMKQFEANQPTTTYKEFKHEILNEIARCLNVPFNVAAGNSSGYNYSSGRLDHQTYFKSIDVEQGQLEITALRPIFQEWLEEAAYTTRLVPGGVERRGGWPHQWLWMGHEHVDPAKEATAQETRLRNLTTSLSEECQKQGVDFETRMRTISKERALLESLGVPLPQVWSEAPSVGAVQNDDASN